MSDRGEALLRFSPLESRRFGLRIFRGSIETIDAQLLASEIERERIDVAIVRTLAPASNGIEALERAELSPILADTQVIYGVDLASYALAPANPSIELRPATRHDAGLLEEMARAIFADYRSHYHANALFGRNKILDGYAEWASSHIDADDGSAAWLVECDRESVGFSCYRIDRDGTAIGVLNGVLPSARGHGVYRGMLRAMLLRFARMGLPRFQIATQTHNTVVIRVWNQERFALCCETSTVHINALRGRAADEPNSP